MLTINAHSTEAVVNFDELLTETINQLNIALNSQIASPISNLEIDLFINNQNIRDHLHKHIDISNNLTILYINSRDPLTYSYSFTIDTEFKRQAIYKKSSKLHLVNIINTENELTEDRIITASENLVENVDKIKASLTSEFSIIDKSKIIIAGDKNTGKSLSCIYLINSLLSMNKSQVSKVFYLDTDLGQSTFQFPGTISLYLIDAPLITNLGDPQFLTPIVTFFIGEFSPINHIDKYLQAISKIIEFYNNINEKYPLIINTHGYITGIGENIFYDIVKIVDPQIILLLEKGKMTKDSTKSTETIVSNIESKNYLHRLSMMDNFLHTKIKNEQMRAEIHQKYKKDIIIMRINQEFEYDHKSLEKFKRLKKDDIISSYFLQSSSNKQINFHDFASPVCKICFLAPYEVDFTDLSFVVFGNEKSMNFNGDKDFIDVAVIFINSIVALYDNSHTNQFALKDVHNELSCKGFGLIVDIDMKNKKIFIATPIDEESLENINVIVKSSDTNFTSSFYNQNIPEILELAEFSFDVRNNYETPRDLSLPFLIDNLSIGIGSEPFRNKISLRKHQ